MDQDLTFDQYLEQKKIDAGKFSVGEKEKYQEMEHDFTSMHPDSFTAQYLFLINPFRRKYPIGSKEVKEAAKPKAAMRPKIKPKI